MADLVKLIFAKPIHLAIQVFNTAGDTSDFYSDECADIEKKIVRLLAVLRQAAKASPDLHERPTRVIIDDTNRVLENAHALLLNCVSYGIFKRVFGVIPASSFKKMSKQLENSIGSVSWLLRVSRSDKVDHDFAEQATRPFSADRSILYLIWDMSASVLYGSQLERYLAAKTLASLAQDQDRYRKQIIEEGSIGPLLKLLVDDGNPQGQENAAKAIGVLGKDGEDVEYLIHAGVDSVLVDVLKEEGLTKKLQVTVVWAISELAGNYPKCQDRFAQHGIIRLLVSKLALGTVDRERSTDTEGGECVDARIQTVMNAMVVRALWHLAVDNAAICRSITESKAMLCFAVLLETGTEDEQYNSAMALMEITAMAEKDTDLVRSAFQPNSSTHKAIVDQLLNIINKRKLDSKLLIPCVKSIGNLARTCKVTETRMISPLARLLEDTEVETKRIQLKGFLEDSEAEAVKEVLIVLSKAVCHENIRCIGHSKAILSTGVFKHLVQTAYYGHKILNIPALIPLSYISSHVPENEELAKHHVLRTIEWAERNTEPYINEIVAGSQKRTGTISVIMRQTPWNSFTLAKDQGLAASAHACFSVIAFACRRALQIPLMTLSLSHLVHQT